VQTLTEIPKRKRLAIKIISTIGVLSLFSLTMTALAWGTADTTIYFLLLYAVLFITTILIIANVRFAYFLIIVIAIIYAILLNREVGEFFVFNNYNKILYLVLALPYFALLTLVPLTTSYLSATAKHKKIFVTTALTIAIGFPGFAIGERYKMDYMSYAFIDAQISSSSTRTLLR
jgi:hypothetical protein